VLDGDQGRSGERQWDILSFPLTPATESLQSEGIQNLGTNCERSAY
jgi:hypothetical protein